MPEDTNQNKLDYLFTRENPFYTKFKTVWKRALASYSGGASYVDTALIKHVSEIDLEFTERKQRAYYFNYPRKIARMITQFVLSVAPTREDTDDDYIEDWSRTGLRTNEVMRQFSTILNVYGVAWLIVDSPFFEGEKNKKQEQDERLRPYVLALSPLSVVDWCYGSDGKFQWVLTQEKGVDNSNPLEKPVEIICRKLWTRNEVTTFIKDDKNVVKMLGKPVSHGLGVVPFIRHEEVDGFGLAANHWFEDVVRVSDAILNNESEAQMNIVKQMFGLLVISEDFAAKGKSSTTEEDEDGELVEKFSHVIARSAAVWESSEEKGITRYVSPSGADTATIRSENNSLRKELFDVVGLAIQKDSKMVESAEAKAWDFQNVEQYMKTRADALEQCELQAWELLAKWQPLLKMPKVSYNKNFSIFELTDSIAALLSLSGINVESDTYQQEIHRVAITMLDRIQQLPQERKEAILKEIEASKPGFKLDIPNVNDKKSKNDVDKED